MLGISPTAPQPSGSKPQASPGGGAEAPSPRKATMLGISPSQPSGPAASQAKPGADPGVKKTMLGMQSPLASRPDAAPPEASPEGDVQQTVFGVDAKKAARVPSEGSPEAVGKQQTMLGMVGPPAGQAPASATPASSPTTPEAAGKQRTMLGMVGPPAGQAPASAPAASGASAGGAGKGRTMLGMVGPLAGKHSADEAPQQGTPSPSAAAAGAAGDPKTNRTMLGMAAHPASGPPPTSSAAPGLAPSEDVPSFSRPQTSVDETDTEDIAQAAGLGGKRSAGKGLWGAVAVVALLLATAALVLGLLGGEPEVGVDVVAQGQGDALRVRVPEAPVGTKVQFAGVERALEGGAAIFPLSADAFQLGENQVSLGIVDPGGDVQAAEVELRVDYRVRMDVSGLSQPQPRVEVVVDAAKGTQVSVGGKSVKLDAKGSARVPFTVGDTAGSRFDLEVPYRLEPPQGQAATGKLELHLPVTSMQIDRPGDEVFTDAARVEIGGAAEPGARVEVDGESVKVVDGRFLHEEPLGEAGEYSFSVVARSEGKAPRARQVKVTRVDDMSVAAAAFEFNEDLKYARMAQNPTIYRGQHVRFDGRVYHVEVQGGRSVLQMLVRDCPRGHKCQLWIDYAQATDATVGSMVRVLGVVTGEQQYRSKKGGVQTAPAISARFILPLVR